VAVAEETRARPVALGIIREGDEIFVFEGHDPDNPETFYRPLGGSIEYGELAADAVRRELKEEIGVTVTDAKLLTVLENLFTWQGRAAHEIVFIFEVKLADPERLRSAALVAYEANGERINCMWKPLADFRNGARLYPAGLLEVLGAGAAGTS
jgi:ADP-ribose pyrophosphatase YjhB (NUDIX family)